MVRHDYIGDIRTEYAKDFGVTIPGNSSTVEAGDHETLILSSTYYSTSGTKQVTIKLQESDDASNWTDIAGSAVSFSATAKDFGQHTHIVERRKHKRYIRADYSTTGAAYVVTGVWLKMGDKVRATETQADTTIV